MSQAPHLQAALRFLSDAWTEDVPYRLLASPRASLTEGRPTSPEVLSPTLVLDLLWGHGLDARVEEGLLRFLRRQLGADGLLSMFTNQTVPPDVDCTGLGLSALLRAGGVEPTLAHRAADRLVGNTLPDGVMEVYLVDGANPRSGRLDAAVCANALYLLHQLGRGGEAGASEVFVLRVLERGDLETFLEQAPYYTSVEVFLYFVSRLAFGFPGALGAHFHEPLRRRLEERRGRVEGPLGLALHLLCSHWAGLRSGDEAARLAAFQREDGGWPPDVLFQFGSRAQGTLRYLGSEVLTTAFATRALLEVTPLSDDEAAISWATLGPRGRM